MESLERGPEIISINIKIFLEKYTNKVKCILHLDTSCNGCYKRNYMISVDNVHEKPK